MRRYPIHVIQGNVTNINVILSPVSHGYATQEFSTLIKGNMTNILIINTIFFYNNIFQLYYLGDVLDLENRPVKGATITDESSSSFSKSDNSGFYKLAVGEGK